MCDLLVHSELHPVRVFDGRDGLVLVQEDRPVVAALQTACGSMTSKSHIMNTCRRYMIGHITVGS